MVYKKLRKNSVKTTSKWFYITIVAYRYYVPVFLFPLQRKKLNHGLTKFTARKQGAVPDQSTT